MTPGCFLKVILSLCCAFPRWDSWFIRLKKCSEDSFIPLLLHLCPHGLTKGQDTPSQILSYSPLVGNMHNIFTLTSFNLVHVQQPQRETAENMALPFLQFTKETFSSFSSWMPSQWEIVRIPGLFAVIIYSSKVIIRHRRRNGRSSAPLLPSPSASHYYNIAALK